MSAWRDRMWTASGGVTTAVVVVLALLAGYGIRSWVGDEPGSAGSAPAATVAATPTTWTCSVHPQIQLPEPGKCPICAMDLIPLEAGGEDRGPRELRLSESAAALAEIVTVPVERRAVEARLRMVGKVAYDETRLKTITAWVPGRIDRLFVDYTGGPVRKGDHLVLLYSPDLLTAQEELLQAKRAVEDLARSNLATVRKAARDMVEAVRVKLRLLGLDAEQIAAIEVRDSPEERITIRAPIGGIVVHKDAVEGMWVRTGTRLVTIADLTRLWVKLDAYETDLPWLRPGQEVEFTTDAVAGRTYTGKIAFIDPVLDDRTRTAKVRLNVDNADGSLKPGTFVRAIARPRIGAGARVVAPDLAGKWICPMHPEEVHEESGECGLCEMPLVRAESLGYVSGETSGELPLVIPASAPLITGERAVVYVRMPGEAPVFEGRDVVLGPRAGDHYVVLEGLREGELVVARGAFKLDSALQIEGRPSMMSPRGGGGGGAHRHGGTAPPSGGRTEHEAQALDVPPAFLEGLTPVYAAGLDLAERLAADDADGARAAAVSLGAAAEGLDVGNLPAGAHEAVWAMLTKVRHGAKEAAVAKDLTVARAAFLEVSEGLVAMARRVGHAGEAEHRVAFCPMAADGGGAEWLQAGDAIRNPYFGSAMLACGEIRATLSGRAAAPPAPPRAFVEALGPVYRAAIAIQSALADDAPEEAAGAAAPFLRALDLVPEDGVTDDVRDVWSGERDALRRAAESLRDAKGIAAQRVAFATLSETLLAVVERFGHALDGSLYRIHCPMAFDDRGADWLQDDPTVANPYFGDAMLRCGVEKRRYDARPADGR